MQLSSTWSCAYRYLRLMGLIEAAAWGLAGDLVAGLLSMSAAVVAAGFKWPC